jgi:hypothetical protein
MHPRSVSGKLLQESSRRDGPALDAIAGFQKLRMEAIKKGCKLT